MYNQLKTMTKQELTSGKLQFECTKIAREVLFFFKNYQKMAIFFSQIAKNANFSKSFQMTIV